ncbi:Pancreatic lipase-related protein 2 [Halotydeus destructor]|nr:Pancreatic lipase-related protein 2 [Halotydeus destructor]
MVGKLFSLTVLIALSGHVHFSEQLDYTPTLITGTVHSFFACAASVFRVKQWYDPNVGNMSLDYSHYCDPTCWRALPGLTCCMPETPETLDVKFHILIPDGGDDVRILKWPDILKEPPIYPEVYDSDRLVFVVHGWFETVETSPWMKRMGSAYRKKGYPTIMVDWRGGNQGSYSQSMANVRTVGAMIARLILTWDMVEKTRFVGFSMGGQMIHETSRYLAKNGGGKMKECHGIDPAGGHFTGCPHISLRKEDCMLTEVLHSSAEVIINAGGVTLNLGTRVKSGHCDYWINCGYYQGIRCTNLGLKEFGNAVGNLLTRSDDIDVAKFLLNLAACGHMRAALVYTALLEGQCSFELFNCADCGQHVKCNPGSTVLAGSIPPQSVCHAGMNTNYYVKSGSKAPYC